ncbi:MULTISPECIES: hypothetical protein [Cellulomonas]|uniref:Lipoprotein n=1 Tax=Cellulomonas iranensis TaxID=76862 RepID=A0ABU0GHA0_9CELL|nr:MULTISPECIES: hypothetical protein [Cellulomonas]MDQ0424739.1 hypothetical protein [Cellulomonas iranensis]UCN14211.1 hypothetical protein LFM56_15185 [Cellulomonas iranensis]
MTRLRPRTARTAAGLAAAAVLALSGCSATNPIATIADYQPSDGVATTVGDVRVLNMIVVAQAEGQPGTLTGALANGSSQDETVTLTIAGEEVRVPVAASTTVLLGAPDAPPRYETADVEVAAVDAAPGGLTTVTVATASSGSVQLQVPVLNDKLPEYQALLPDTTATSTATPAATRDASQPSGQEGDEEG